MKHPNIEGLKCWNICLFPQIETLLFLLMLRNTKYISKKYYKILRNIMKVFFKSRRVEIGNLKPFPKLATCKV